MRFHKPSTTTPAPLPGTRRAPLSGIVYSSRATAPFDDTELGELLTRSRNRNEDLEVTGVLLYRDGRFLRHLEGPGDSVTHQAGRIRSDPRHHDFTLLVAEPLDS